MEASLKSIEKRIEKLEKLKQIAAYRYSQGQTSDLKEIIDLEKLSLSTDRQELIKSLKRENLMKECLMEIGQLKDIESLKIIRNCITEIVIDTGFDDGMYQQLLNSVSKNKD